MCIPSVYLTMEPNDVRLLLEAHRSLIQQAAKIAAVLKPHLLQVGDKVTDSDSKDEHEVVAVVLSEDGYGVELGTTYCGGGFVLRGDCVKKVSHADASPTRAAPHTCEASTTQCFRCGKTLGDP